MEVGFKLLGKCELWEDGDVFFWFIWDESESLSDVSDSL